MAKAWQYIPTSILDEDKQRQEAEAWAGEQRQRLAQQWADVQRRMIPPPPEQPPEPPPEQPPEPPSPEGPLGPGGMNVGEYYGGAVPLDRAPNLTESPDAQDNALGWMGRNLLDYGTRLSPVRAGAEYIQENPLPEGASPEEVSRWVRNNPMSMGLVMGMSGPLKEGSGLFGSKVGEGYAPPPSALEAQAMRNAKAREGLGLTSSEGPAQPPRRATTPADDQKLLDYLKTRLQSAETPEEAQGIQSSIKQLEERLGGMVKGGGQPKYFYAVSNDLASYGGGEIGGTGDVHRFTSKAERDDWVGRNTSARREIDNTHHYVDQADALGEQGWKTEAGSPDNKSSILLISKEGTPGRIQALRSQYNERLAWEETKKKYGRPGQPSWSDYLAEKGEGQQPPISDSSLLFGGKPITTLTEAIRASVRTELWRDDSIEALKSLKKSGASKADIEMQVEEVANARAKLKEINKIVKMYESEGGQQSPTKPLTAEPQAPPPPEPPLPEPRLPNEPPPTPRQGRAWYRDPTGELVEQQPGDLYHEWLRNRPGGEPMQSPEGMGQMQTPYEYAKPTVEMPPGYKEGGSVAPPEVRPPSPRGVTSRKGVFPVPPSEDSSFAPNMTREEQAMGQRLREVSPWPAKPGEPVATENGIETGRSTGPKDVGLIHENLRNELDSYATEVEGQKVIFQDPTTLRKIVSRYADPSLSASKDPRRVDYSTAHTLSDLYNRDPDQAALFLRDVLYGQKQIGAKGARPTKPVSDSVLQILDDYAQARPSQTKSGTNATPYVMKKPTSNTRFINRATNALKTFGEHGKILAQMPEDHRNLTMRLNGDFGSRLRSVFKLSDKDFDELIDVVRGKAQPSNTNIRMAADTYRPVMDEVQRVLQKTLEDVGSKKTIGYTKNYYPQIYDQKMFEDPKLYDELVHKMVKDGKAASVDEAHGMLEKQIDTIRNTDAIRNRLDANLELQRLIDLPMWRRDKAALKEYIEMASHRIAELKVYGLDDSHALHEIKKLGEQGYDSGVATTIFNAIVSPKYDRVASKVAGTIRAFNTLTKLGLWALANAAQSSNTATVTGGVRTLKNVKGALTNLNLWYDAERIGVISDDIIAMVRKDQGIATGKWASRIMTPGGIAVEKFNRVVAAASGKDYASAMGKAAANKSTVRFWAQGRAKEALTKLGLDANAIIQRGGVLTQSELDRAALEVVKRTQYYQSTQDLPYFVGSNPWWKTITLYKTFPYNQTAFFIREVIQPALHGEVRPMMRFLIYNTLAGGAVYEAKSAVTGYRDESPVMNAVGWLTSGGGPGLIADTIIRAFPQSKQSQGAARDTIRALGVLLGPTEDTIARGIMSSIEAAHGKPNDLYRFGVGMAGFPGKVLPNRLFPYEQSQSGGGSTTPRGGTIRDRALNPQRQPANAGGRQTIRERALGGVR